MLVKIYFKSFIFKIRFLILLFYNLYFILIYKFLHINKLVNVTQLN